MTTRKILLSCALAAIALATAHAAKAQCSENFATYTANTNAWAVGGWNSNTSVGVGVAGFATTDCKGSPSVLAGVYGDGATSSAAGVYGTSSAGDGVDGEINNAQTAVNGHNSGSGNGVSGRADGAGFAVAGYNHSSGNCSGNLCIGVYGQSSNGSGVTASSTNGYSGNFTLGSGKLDAGIYYYNGNCFENCGSDVRLKKDIAPLTGAL
jgi:hypothetical protein